MPQLVSNMVDAYIFRRVNARLQFLLLLRRPDLPLGNTWQSIHTKILPGETAVDAAKRAMEKETGMTALEAYSADYINQFYDHHTDSIILAPVFAFAVPQRPSITLGEELCDSAWCERDEATARLLWPGQRWAVRHIDAILGLASEDAEFFRIA
jgi:dATP pyrophosphohydrolase